MKAKTTKFLAVLAVLAMAFAGVAVLAQDQNVADAAAEEGAAERAEGHNVSLTIGATTTYYTTAAKAFAAVESNEKATITLLASHIGEGLKTGDGVKYSTVTIDFAGFTYTVNQGVGSAGTETAGAQLLKDNIYIFKNGTMDVAPMEGTEKKRSNVINNYSDLTLTDMVIDGTNLKAGFNWCTDPSSTKEEGGMTVAVWLSNGEVKINGSTTIIKGTHGAKNFGLGVDSWKNDAYNGGARVEVDTTGEIDGILMAQRDGGATTPSTMVIKNASIYGNVYTYASMANDKFEIKGATVPAGKTLTNNGVLYLAEGDVLTVNGTLVNNGTINNGGTLNGTGVVEVKKTGNLSAPAGATFGLAGSLDLTILEGADVPANVIFAYVDEYGDTHSFKTDAALTVQMGDFQIYAEENNLTVDGTALMKANANFVFTGNVWLCGTIYTIAPGTTGAAFTLSIDNSQGVDVKVEMFQTVGSGAIELRSPVLVVPNSTFNVGGTLRIDGTSSTSTAKVAVLKVADGAVVKSAGAITTTVGKGYIWNAGSVYAPATQDYTDSQLVRVFMNNVAGTGLFYKGSAVYEGKETADTFTPLAVAYGAYLDITGICDVNITSGQTSVVNPLYKYYTMTLATDDSNIALNVDYDNYYTPEIDLLKKASASKEKSGKYVTFRGVNWNTADSAVIQINVPEEYEVKLVSTIEVKTVEDAKVPALSGPIASDIKLTDQFNRTITPDDKGIVKLVFGYVYTIEGANSTSKYKFIDYFELFEDLDPVDKTKATFTMVRGPTVYAFDVGTTTFTPAPEKDLEFGVLQITEGKLSKVNVTVTPTDNMTEGQVFLYYKVEKDGQEMPVAYSKVADNMVIDGIYSNDNLYFKTVDRDFYKYQFGTFPTETGKAWQVNPALSSTDSVSIPIDKWTAVAGVTGSNGVVDKDGKGGVELPIVIIEDSIELVASVDLGDATSKAATQTFTITWVNVQKTSVTVSSNDKYTPQNATQNATEQSGKLVKLLADEIITITWEDVDDVRQTMKILGKEYTKGTEYTVSTDVSENTEKTMKLTLDKIEYAKVKNSSTKDFTVTDGNFTNAVAKTKTVDKAVEAFNTSVTATNAKPTLVTLVIEGQSVVSWTYTLWDAKPTPVKVQNYIEKNVVGETTAIPLVDGYTIEVTALNTIYNQYIVKTQPVDHVQIGDYSRLGHMNDNMFVYYSVDDKYTLKGVEVYYEDPENEGFPDIERGVYAYAEPKTAADGQKYWAYKMPASNVYLKPIVDSDYAIITYKNYDGTVLQTGEVKKGTMPEYTGATPVKPATATETYRFAGWEPAVVAVTADATYTATFETVAPTSTDVTIFLEKAQGGVRVTLLSNDGRFIQDGSVEITYYYAYQINGVWTTGFLKHTEQTGEIGDKTVYQFTIDLSGKERFAETMWVDGTYTSADKAVSAESGLIVYQ